MKIEHVAIWTKRLEVLRDFYVRYFGCTAGAKYTESPQNFSSYFLSFPSGARIELMSVPEVKDDIGPYRAGFTHIALSVGSEEEVTRLTEHMRSQGITIHSNPRHTGDGYFESVIVDPDGNLVELTI